MTTVYLVRHGETDGNRKQRFQGTKDYPLNAQGRRQGELLGSALKDYPIDVIYTSPLSRAWETARLIAKHHPGVQVIPHGGLEEIHAGVIEGEKLADLPVKYPEVYRQMLGAPVHLAYPGGETTRQVYDRVAKAIQDIVKQNKDRVIVVVSHGFAIQTYLHYASGRPFEEMQRQIVTNTSITKFVYGESLTPQLKYADRHDHLSQEDFVSWNLEEAEKDIKNQEQ